MRTPPTSPRSRPGDAAGRSPGGGALRTEHQTALRGAVGGGGPRGAGPGGGGGGAGHARLAALGRVDRVVRAVRSLQADPFAPFGVPRTTRPGEIGRRGRGDRPISARHETRWMTAHPSVIERLGRLSPDQHAAATAPPGPVLCVAPAGSGKTTTLVARVAWRIDHDTPPDRVCVLTFNRRAADELRVRLGEALAPLGIGPDAVRR